MQGIDDMELGDFELSVDEDLVKSVEDALGTSLIELNAEEGEENFELDLFSDTGEELSEAILLRSEVDTAESLLSMYKLTHEANQVVFAKTVVANVDRFAMDRSEFPYMSDSVFRATYAIFIDIVLKSENASLTLEQAVDKARNELYNKVGWAPRADADRFNVSTSMVLAKFRKIAGAAEAPNRNSMSCLLDEHEMMEAERVFRVNSLAFTMITVFLKDKAALNLEEQMDTTQFGDLTANWITEHGLTKFTVSDGYDLVFDFLSSEDIRVMLQLTTDEMLRFSIGELLRRVVGCELSNGVLYPSGLLGVPLGAERLFAEIIDSLTKSMEKGSASAELLLVLIVMMLAGLRNDSKSARESDARTRRCLVNLAEFMQAFLQDAALIHPVFYASATKTGRTSQSFELGYATDNESYTVESEGVLCHVVGDNTSSYCMPTIVVDSRHGCTICPPDVVVNSLRAAVNGGKLKINSAASYKFIPTVEWLSTCKLVVQDERPKEDPIDATSIGAGVNQLLTVLLEYTNEFENSKEDYDPQPVLIHAEGVCDILAVRTEEEGTVRITRMTMPTGTAVITEGNFAEVDGSLVVNYIDPLTKRSQVLVLNSNEYDEQFLDNYGDEATMLPGYEEFVYVGNLDSLPSGNECYLRAVAQRVCTLNALDYKQLLGDARKVIARDLFYTLKIPAIDHLLGSKLLEEFVELLGEGGELDSSNLQTLKEICIFTIGKDHPLKDTVVWDGAARKLLDTVVEQARLTVENVCESLDMVDYHLLALQMLSRSELSRPVEMSRYRAMHFIPEIHSRLRALEDQMIILRAVQEVGEEIVPILKKRTSLLSAYNEVCTLETLPRLIARLRESNKDKRPGNPLSATQYFLENADTEGSPILKYFILQRSMRGVLTELEESGKPEANELHCKLVKALGLPAGFTTQDMTEAEWAKTVDNDDIAKACLDCRAALVGVVERGLFTEANANVPLSTIRAYDILCSYGRVLFQLGTEEKAKLAAERGEGDLDSEDFTDTSEFEEDFYTYAGSLVISYCPVTGDSVNDIDGGLDHVAAFLSKPSDFNHHLDLGFFNKYELTDMRVIV